MAVWTTAGVGLGALGFVLLALVRLLWARLHSGTAWRFIPRGLDHHRAGYRRDEIGRALAPDSPSSEGSSLGIRVEIITRGDDGPIFPYRLRFLDAERKDSGLRIELQLARSVDRFLETLRSVLTLDIDDPRRSRRPKG